MLKQPLPEWHPTKNLGLTPATTALLSNKKIRWICPRCDNEYEMSISLRSHGSGCPKCAIKRNGIKKRKAVEMIDSSTNKVLKTFESISEASKTMNINDSNISMVCKGQREKTGGYKWRYKNYAKPERPLTVLRTIPTGAAIFILQSAT